MSTVNTSVEDWLRSLGLPNYSEAFIDNGYDDLDICKQIGDEDLDAIGVINSKDRRDILHSVSLLKDKGVNAVYFQLEGDETANTTSFGQSDREKYRREDLINRMKELLSEDNCVLQDHNPNNDHDPVDALAQYYADQLYTYVQDVKEVLEYLRDGESNEGSNETSSPQLPPKKKQNLNPKLANESTRYLSKSLNSLDSSLVQGKTPKSPKHGRAIGRIFSSKKSKNYIQQPPKICGPIETAILASQVTMSDDDRKILMLQVKHGDITQDQAMSNFLSYEATHITSSKEQDKSGDKQSKKKRGGFFNRSSFKRHSSGHSSEVLASNIALGEKDRMDLMRQVKTGEITREEAFDRLSRIGSKRESKNNKSPKHQRGSKSPKSKDRISSSSFHLHVSTFYTGATPDISQSTSNIPSRTNSTDSSPDSTPGFPRKLDLQLNQSNSAEQLGSNGSFESMDTKGNYSKPKSGPPVLPKRSPSPLTHTDLRRTVSAKGGDAPREAEVKRRSTLSSVSDVQVNRHSCEKPPQNITNEKESTEMNQERLSSESGPPVPSRRPPKLPPNKPVLSQVQTTPTEPPQIQQNKPSSQNSPEAKKPKLPDKPMLPTKPSLRPKPPIKPHRFNTLEKSATTEPGDKEMNKNGYKKDEKATLISIVNGVLDNHDPSVTETSSKGEVTSEEKVEIKNARIPPRRPSPFTRVSRQKPLGPKLLEMIEVKLKDEGIDLVQEPYTVEKGEWGVPMTLIDRYSCELDATMREVTKEMDHIRIEKLNQVNKMATPCDLTHLRFAPDVIGKLASMVDWLTSLGLPMYIDNLMEAGYDDVHQIPYLSEEHLDFANITIPQHRHRLIRSLENMTPTYDRQTSFDE